MSKRRLPPAREREQAVKVVAAAAADFLSAEMYTVGARAESAGADTAAAAVAATAALPRVKDNRRSDRDAHARDFHCAWNRWTSSSVLPTDCSMLALSGKC